MQEPFYIRWEVPVQLDSTCSAIIIGNIYTVSAHRSNYTWFICPFSTKLLADKILHGFATGSVERLHKWLLALYKRYCLCSVLGVMSYNAVATGVQIVIYIKVYHHSRGLDLNDVHDTIKCAITEACCNRYQLNCEHRAVSRRNVPEYGICIEPGEHEGQAATDKLVVDVHKPDISVIVHANVVYLLSKRVQERCYEFNTC